LEADKLDIFHVVTTITLQRGGEKQSPIVLLFYDSPVISD
jgi:hypothetical protein